MKKSTLNLVIDTIMLIVMMAIIGIGLLVKYILLTGQEKWDKFGENFEFIYLGLDRHEWGEIHYILGIVLFGLLVLHILLHWKMVVCIYKNMIKNRFLRIFLAIVLLIVSMGLIIFPFVEKPTKEDPVYHIRNHQVENKNEVLNNAKLKHIETPKKQNIEVQPTKQHTEDIHHNIPSNIEVIGSMTLMEVSRKYDVPVNHIKEKLNIPISTSNNERLGRLRRSLGFTMSTVEEIIYIYQKENKNGKKN